MLVLANLCTLDLLKMVPLLKHAGIYMSCVDFRLFMGICWLM
jgi:hypothetical protein